MPTMLEDPGHSWPPPSAKDTHWNWSFIRAVKGTCVRLHNLGWLWVIAFPGFPLQHKPSNSFSLELRQNFPPTLHYQGTKKEPPSRSHGKCFFPLEEGKAGLYRTHNLSVPPSPCSNWAHLMNIICLFFFQLYIQLLILLITKKNGWV